MWARCSFIRVQDLNKGALLFAYQTRYTEKGFVSISRTHTSSSFAICSGANGAVDEAPLVTSACIQKTTARKNVITDTSLAARDLILDAAPEIALGRL